MTSPGAGLVQLMRDVRRLFQETSLLLETADQLMKKSEWILETNQCVSVTTVPGSAAYWLPQCAFRFYKNEHYQHVLAFVSVVFDDSDNDRLVVEPLLTGGWFGFKRGTRVARQSYEFDDAFTHIYQVPRRDDGTLVSNNPQDLFPDYKDQAESVTTLGIPLLEVTTSDQLKNRLIVPLLAGIESRAVT